ncbi:MAG TPA: 16S rRNA (guanine(966)-N(2))-methyltransferase RsmD [Myxococcota bacterium]|nr:MAG: Ribosomal RNA small subunit methyltransferase D [Deltaproteobacteria bacterium ADurb.Bin058]HON24805.1 16S rRNA (guanine(966)-N(2))-methyltransferase RsmD [Myxococcota bacterium]HPC90814.1 16S rRNA (guanine(966)-N(2))-methyltransferase RsmD [Myxococcota bacterium]HRV16880.1 16S rRNA (guanine(966)-N(2))-methyltransferase RsmD [Myxococcota bacterium]
MRIVAGALGGRRLVAPKGRGVRPTLEKVREAVFSILGARVVEARVLDLFAGSGAMGIEALSRGALSAVWCDVDERSIAAIQENVEKLGLIKQGNILHMTAQSAIRYMSRKGRQFDIIFMDPPYEQGLYEITLMELAGSSLIKSNSIVCVEHPKRAELPTVFGSLIQDRRRQYGDSAVTFYQRSQ